MKRIIAFILVFYTCELSFAQDEVLFDSPKKVRAENPFFKRAFTIPFTSLYDFTSPSINIGFEQSINKHFGIQTTLGYSNNYINPIYHLIRATDYNGAKVALDLRYYFARKRKVNLFFTPALFYKAIFENHNDMWVSRYNGQYRQKISFKRVIQMAALTPKFGLVFLKPDKAVGFEFSVGVGVRFQHISFINLPDDVVYNNGNDFFFTNSRNINKDKGLFIRPNAFLSLALLIAGKQRR